MKVAVVGSGAASAGVMLGLIGHREPLSIDIFDNARPTDDNGAHRDHPSAWPKGELAAIYRRVAEASGRSFPLPKSHFGLTVPRIAIDGRPRIWSSSFRGGLSNFWGASMMPLPNCEFQNWPLSRGELQTYYDRVAAKVGVAGAPDGLTGPLGGEHANRPVLRIHPMIERMIAAIEQGALGAAAVRAGVNRAAIETRTDHADSCVYCGECMIGCFRGAVFTTAPWMERWSADGTIASLNSARVTRIDLRARRLTIAPAYGPAETTGSYDRIFVAAGCPGSTRLLMDSLGVDRAVMKDSKVFTTPIVFKGSRAEEPIGEVFGLTHGVALIPDPLGARIAAQVQLYPTLPHFWRSVVPAPLWGAAGAAAARLRRRLFFARCYLSNEAANRYVFQRRSDGHVDVHLAEAQGTARFIDFALGRLAAALNGSGFWLVRGLASQGRTSSHYGASEPFQVGAGLVDKEWRLTDGVYLVDSTAWPEVPAISPTMTIMANAMRIAERSFA